MDRYQYIPPRREPIFNNLPPVILILCGAIIGVHALDAWLLSSGQTAFHAVLLDAAAVRTGSLLTDYAQAPLGGYSPYFMHVFVHFGWVHLFMNIGALLAFGAVSLRPFGSGLIANLGFLTFFFVCAIAGAGLATLVHYDEPQIMAGASTSISGLLASAGWARGGYRGMLSLAGPWLLINLAMAVADQLISIPISWSGHIGGLLVGMIAYPAFVRFFNNRNS